MPPGAARELGPRREIDQRAVDVEEQRQPAGRARRTPAGRVPDRRTNVGREAHAKNGFVPCLKRVA
jgi:hypothetical protein